MRQLNAWTGEVSPCPNGGRYRGDDPAARQGPNGINITEGVSKVPARPGLHELIALASPTQAPLYGVVNDDRVQGAHEAQAYCAGPATFSLFGYLVGTLLRMRRAPGPLPRRSTGYNTGMGPKSKVATFVTVIATLTGGLADVGEQSAWAGPAAAPSGAKLLSEIQKAVASQRGFQWSDKGIEEGTTEYETTYVGKDAGSQSVSIQQSAGTGTIAVTVIGSTAYFKGNSQGLTLLGFGSSAARGEAGKWVSVTAAANQNVYQSIAGGLTSSSVAANMSMTGPVSQLRKSKIAGQSVVGLKGNAAPASGQQSGTSDTLYISASGTPLPVELVQDNPSSGNTYMYSHWGVAPRVNAPRGAVPYQTSWA